MAKEMTTSCLNATDLATLLKTVDIAVENSMPTVNCRVSVANTAPPTKMSENITT